jgi:hypothetical protein
MKLCNSIKTILVIFAILMTGCAKGFMSADKANELLDRPDLTLEQLYAEAGAPYVMRTTRTAEHQKITTYIYIIPSWQIGGRSAVGFRFVNNKLISTGAAGFDSSVEIMP